MGRGRVGRNDRQIGRLTSVVKLEFAYANRRFSSTLATTIYNRLNGWSRRGFWRAEAVFCRLKHCRRVAILMTGSPETRPGVQVAPGTSTFTRMRRGAKS